MNGELQEYKGDAKDVVISDGVTSIAAYAFNNKFVTSITIPDGVVSIGEGAFLGCPKLAKVTIPDSVTSIGLAAFMACHSLKSVAIPKNAKLGPRAFMKCTKLTTVIIPDSVTHIGKQAFLVCKELTIFGKAGSYAQKYAKKNDIPFFTEKPKNRQTLSGIKEYSKTYGDKSFKLNVKLTKGNGVLSYKSSDTKVAKVDNKGNVTIKGTGIATITVTAKQTSKYNTATARIMVNIRPAKPKAPMLSAQGNQINTNWKADKNATGYEIQYSTDRNFKNKKVTKIVTVKNRKVTTNTLKNVTKGKKYYVRIRSYKNAKISGKTQKIYSAWSGAKNIKP